jgi:hypothetical protein
MIVPIIPEMYCSPLMCRDNVFTKIAHDGGEAVFGWRVSRELLYSEYQAHCVWRSPNGELFDVTPTCGEIDDDGYAATTFVIGNMSGHCEFIDGEADWGNLEKAPNSRFVPHDPNNRDVVLACRYLSRSTNAELRARGTTKYDRAWQEMKKWDEKAARHLSRAAGQRINIWMEA